MIENNILPVYGKGGDALMVPENTETAYWAALAAGGQGFVAGLRLTKDKVVVCIDHDTFEATGGDPAAVNSMNWDEIVTDNYNTGIDIGHSYRSTELDADGQPTGNYGTDYPWRRILNVRKHRPLRVPKLEDVLILFARRCQVFLGIPDGDEALIEETLSLLNQYGVLNRVVFIASEKTANTIKAKESTALVAVEAALGQNLVDAHKAAADLGAVALLADWEEAFIPAKNGFIIEPDLGAALASGGPRLLLSSDKMPYTATKAYLDAAAATVGIAGVVTRGVLPTIERLTPPARIAADKFAGKSIDTGLWSAGYSHQNRDTEIFVDDGLHIDIKDLGDEGRYSGAAAICLIPLHGRFDAMVDFNVTNPQQATTFEMAAICIDPGYHNMDNRRLNSRNVNLTFDVHGAPPYASSERDQDNGFRCGWNNAYNLTRILEDWSAASANMYNKYGRDAGSGAKDNPNGSLRLIRNGEVFGSYYRDKYNDAWVCSGVMLVQSMAEDAYVRLAAKHWGKGGNPPPGNHVTFFNFQLFQF